MSARTTVVDIGLQVVADIVTGGLAGRTAHRGGANTCKAGLAGRALIGAVAAVAGVALRVDAGAVAVCLATRTARAVSPRAEHAIRPGARGTACTTVVAVGLSVDAGVAAKGQAGRTLAIAIDQR